MENKDTQDKGKPAGNEMNKPQGTSTGASSTTLGQGGNQPGNQPGSQPGNQSGSQTGNRQSVGSATQASRYQESNPKAGGEQAEWNDMKERGAEMVDQAKQTVTDAYKRTSQSLNEGYEQAVGYGREHPGQTAAICFGIGVGVGLWLASGASSRSRSSRIVPPVMNALSDIAVQLFR